MLFINDYSVIDFKNANSNLTTLEVFGKFGCVLVFLIMFVLSYMVCAKLYIRYISSYVKQMKLYLFYTPINTKTEDKNFLIENIA